MLSVVAINSVNVVFICEFENVIKLTLVLEVVSEDIVANCCETNVTKTVTIEGVVLLDVASNLFVDSVVVIIGCEDLGGFVLTLFFEAGGNISVSTVGFSLDVSKVLIKSDGGFICKNSFSAENVCVLKEV
uniref:Uncharacterized protein n=1 Tax=Strongyloides papillosus TaxID=174720 RepID=A0A0N5C650_STREA